MNTRRKLIFGAAGVAAATAGVAWQLHHEAAADDDGDLWSQRFPRVDGSEIVMAAHRGKPLLLNFWATWCVPCIEEMPALERFHRRFAARGWQVVGLAIDSPGPVLQFLQRVKVSFEIGVTGYAGSELARRLGNTQGALPFTVVFDAKGRIVQRKLGQTHDDELTRWGQQG